MDLSRYGISPDDPVARRIAALLEKEKDHPYNGAVNNPAHNIPRDLEIRLSNWFAALAELGLDVVAAATLISVVEYLSEPEMTAVWRELGSKLSAATDSKLWNPDSTWIVTVPNDSLHRDKLFSANSQNNRRSSAPFDDVYQAWKGAFNLIEAEFSPLTKLKAISNAEHWVLLWDFCLSGTSVRAQIKYLHNLAQSLGVVPKIKLGCAICTHSAQKKLDEMRHDYGFDFVVGKRINHTYTQALSGHEVNPETIKRVENFFEGFYRGAVKERAEFYWQRHVKKAGYGDGGLVLVYAENCANNSVLPLWHSEDGGIVGPFPRTWSDERKRLDEEIPGLKPDDSAIQEKCRQAFDYSIKRKPGGPSGRPPEVLLNIWDKEIESLRSVIFDSGLDESKKAAKRSATVEACDRLLFSADSYGKTDEGTAVGALARLMAAYFQTDADPQRAVLLTEADDLWDSRSRDYTIRSASLFSIKIQWASLRELIRRTRHEQLAAKEMLRRPGYSRVVTELPFWRINLEKGLPAIRQEKLIREGSAWFSSRAARVRDWVQRLQEPRGKGGAQVVLRGSLRFGKTTFAERLMQELKLPTVLTDLHEAATDLGLAQALFSGIRGALPTAEIDRRPISTAVNILSEILPQPASFLFAGADQAAPGLAPGFPELVRQLVARGHIVIVESGGAASILPDAEVLELDKIDQEEELRAYGRFRLERDPLNQEVSLIRAYADGHPAFIKGLLARFRQRGAAEMSDGELLPLMEHCEQLRNVGHRLVDSLLREQGPAVPAAQPFAEALVAWAAVFPWFDIEQGELPGPAYVNLLELQQLGLARPLGRQFCLDTWCRAIAIVALRRDPEILERQTALLHRLGRREHPDISLQRRHFTALASLLPVKAALFQSLLSALPDAVPPPLTDAVLDEYKEPSAALDQARWPADGPAELLLEQAEAAARRRDTVTTLGWLDRLLADPEAPAVLAAKWPAVRLLCTTLSRLEGPAADRAHLYARLIERLLQKAMRGSSLSVRLWTARLLADAASLHASVDRAQSAQYFLDAAESCLPSMNDRIPVEIRHLLQDTRYRLRRVGTVYGTSMKSLASAHNRALAAIPPESEWSAGHENQWTQRQLRHLRQRLSAQANPQEFERVLDDVILAFDRLSPSLEWLRLWIRYRNDAEELADTVRDRLEQVWKRRIKSLGELLSPEVLELALLMRQQATPAQSRTALMRLVETARHDALAPLDVEACRAVALCLEQEYSRAVRSRVSGPNLGSNWSKVKEGLEALVQALGSLIPPSDTASPAMKARRVCLDLLARFDLRPLEHAVHCAAQEMQHKGDRSASCRSALERRYGQLIGSDPSLWENWAWMQLRLASLRSHLGSDSVAELTSFCSKVERSSENSFARRAALLRIHEYLWDYADCVTILSQAQGLWLDWRQRRTLARLGVDALKDIVLLPKEMRSWDPQEADREQVQHLFCNLLLDLTYTLGSSAEREMAEDLIRLIQEKENPSFWQSIIAKWETLLPVDRIWSVMVQLANQSSMHRTEEEATDLRRLTDSKLFAAWARVFRLGAMMDTLETPQRVRLAELGVLASYILGSNQQWSPMAKFQRGLAIGVAMLCSQGTLLCEHRESPETGRNGQPILWPELMAQDFHTAKSSFGKHGAFSAHVKKTTTWLMKAVPPAT